MKLKACMADFILILTILVIVTVLIFIPKYSTADEVLYADIIQDGKIVTTLRVPASGSDKQYVFEDGTVVHACIEGVCIKNATCPDKFCEHSGYINKKGQTLVCLPNRIIVKIRGEYATAGVDAIAG